MKCVIIILSIVAMFIFFNISKVEDNLITSHADSDLMLVDYTNGKIIILPDTYIHQHDKSENTVSNVPLNSSQIMFITCILFLMSIKLSLRVEQ